MEKPFIGQQIVSLHSVDSTNDYAHKAFKSGKIASGTMVVAEFQTRGRGQREKSWQAEPSTSLLASITADLDVWKINNIISLNHIVALSIHEFLNQYVTNTSIKWPNDIMVSDQKIAGILIELHISSNSRKAIIGFGININQTSFDIPRATSLFIENNKRYDPKMFIAPLIKIFNAFIEMYQNKEEAYLHELFNQQLWKVNQDHLFEIDGIKKTGKIITSTMEGQLIVQHTDQKKHYSNGEIKY